MWLLLRLSGEPCQYSFADLDESHLQACRGRKVSRAPRSLDDSCGFHHGLAASSSLQPRVWRECVSAGLGNGPRDFKDLAAGLPNSASLKGRVPAISSLQARPSPTRKNPFLAPDAETD